MKGCNFYCSTVYRHSVAELQPSTLNFLRTCTRQSDSYGRRRADVVLSLWSPAHTQSNQQSIHDVCNYCNERTYARRKKATKIKTKNVLLLNSAMHTMRLIKTHYTTTQLQFSTI